MDKYIFGYLPNYAGGSWAVGERTEQGMLDPKYVTWVPSAEEAERLCEELNTKNN